MPIVRIGKIECRNERLVSRDRTITGRPVHEIARALQGGAVSVRLVAQQRLDPLPMDVRRPFRLEYAARRQLKEDVADGRGVGVEKNPRHERS